MPVAVDFTQWTAESLPNTDLYSGKFGSHKDATWTVESPNAVFLPNQPGQNSAPSVFCSPDTVLAPGFHMEGKMTIPEVEGMYNKNHGGTDDDFFGFAIGYKPSAVEGEIGDFAKPNPGSSAKYYVIDWKRKNQNLDERWNPCGDTGISAQKGMSAILVEGQPAESEFWDHEDESCVDDKNPGSVTEIARANTLGNEPWKIEEVYDFCLAVTTDYTITLSINGVEEINIPNADLDSDARFCFYTFSQDDPRFYDVAIEPLGKHGCDGDPHFKTWTNEHFEYHGQCDLVLAKDEDFAEGLGLDVQIRTKLVRYWSYIKSAAIRIGNDILEIEGSAKEFDSETHYWLNYEYQAELTEFGGFPVTIFAQKGTRVHKNRIEIDLTSKYPGHKIVLSTFKEFVKVQFINSSEKAYGNTVGMMGDFKTGKTLARDGFSEINHFADYGHEWQVLPTDAKLFRVASKPQFPEPCIDPEDPRGERKRRLGESTVSIEDAEAACAGLKDELDRKDCVYDILATQDMDMVGAY